MYCCTCRLDGLVKAALADCSGLSKICIIADRWDTTANRSPGSYFCLLKTSTGQHCALCRVGLLCYLCCSRLAALYISLSKRHVQEPISLAGSSEICLDWQELSSVQDLEPRHIRIDE